eukprot:761544-Hanusia_phi.AAC.2
MQVVAQRLPALLVLTRMAGARELLTRVRPVLRGGQMDSSSLMASMKRLEENGLQVQEIQKLAAQHQWSNESVASLINLLNEKKFGAVDKSSKLAYAKHAKIPLKNKPRVAMFMHSLERNGANNFCLHLIRKLMGSQAFTVIFAPKEGPMRQDFEVLGLSVDIVDPSSKDFLVNLEQKIVEGGVGMVFANTIMRCDVVNLSHKLGLPTVWVIHEAWPQDQLDYYAKEVFMMKSLSSEMIKEAFSKCGCVVFPSNVQKDIYKGLYRPNAALTVYNGIPLTQLDAFRLSHDRNAVRKALGYGPEDFVVLHLGTICNRKGQIYTAQACADLVEKKHCKDLKCLMVGARYIRDHEIKYIDQIKETARASGLQYARWEDTPEEERGQAKITLMDIQADVLRFYMAADVVLVPSLNEVLPLVICEAMAFERPVVCSAIDAIPEAVDDGVEGILVPPADAASLSDAIFKLYQDPELRRKLGKAGRQRVLRQFSYDAMIARYGEVMDELIEDNLESKGPSVGDEPPQTSASSSNMAPLRMVGGWTVPPLNLKGTAETSACQVENPSKIAGRTILVDMDNTVVDWDGMFIKRYGRAIGADEARQKEIESKVRSREHFEIEHNFEEQERAKVMDVIASPGFFAELEPLPGAIEALKEMVDRGVDVRLVTAPHPVCPGPCANEKYDFLLRHFGSEWIDRMIITRDKTHVVGAALIDDKPAVTGSAASPPWNHVLFDQPYNRGVEGKSRLRDWVKWEEILSDALKL